MRKPAIVCVDLESDYYMTMQITHNLIKIDHDYFYFSDKNSWYRHMERNYPIDLLINKLYFFSMRPNEELLKIFGQKYSSTPAIFLHSFDLSEDYHLQFGIKKAVYFEGLFDAKIFMETIHKLLNKPG